MKWVKGSEPSVKDSHILTAQRVKTVDDADGSEAPPPALGTQHRKNSIIGRVAEVIGGKKHEDDNKFGSVQDSTILAQRNCPHSEPPPQAKRTLSLFKRKNSEEDNDKGLGSVTDSRIMARERVPHSEVEGGKKGVVGTLTRALSRSEKKEA
eukprot:CAMPEP_0204351088 /NCGR_PEP_ID=MMETSP0469-20131031/30835_1 /ASSEMBLY_ACC=CAM_ASM_000384 /TAXON_ID=2969 /ORGANISM="Oxyrrhis marina" /LENGTH=151 /DNA_ID=CAMNT_0051337557 /DNA_START=29 /DNA_END=482 /DNA_ORIENTATION=-